MTAVEQASRRAVAQTIARLAQRLRAEMPDARIETGEDGVIVNGRDLTDRPALRWPAGWIR